MEKLLVSCSSNYKILNLILKYSPNIQCVRFQSMQSTQTLKSDGLATYKLKKRCAIIGAGASGIPSARWALAYGVEPVVFETTNDVGGMWKFKPEDTELASVMKSTVINTSKEMTAFSDFPPPPEFPNFMHNTHLHRYFEMYAKHHNLYPYIRFKNTVQKVRRAEDYKETGRWEVEFIDSSGQQKKEIFDGVLLCNGHHAKPYIPTPWPGQDKFKGRILHSHDYRDPLKGFQDSVTVVVGIGNSGADVAVEQSRISRETYLSTRRGAWILYKVAKFGVPFDFNLNRRLVCYMRKFLPTNILTAFFHHDLNKRFDHANYGLKPKHSIIAQHPTVNEEISNRLISGLLVIKPNIKSFTENGIVWEDGTKTDKVDNVVLATGYLFGYNVVEDGNLIPVNNNEVSTLYKYIFPADLADHNTLGVIGTFQPVGSIMPISEMQARVFFHAFDGQFKLPNREAMLKDIRDKREENKNRYVASLRHTIQVDYVEFMDELGDMIGCTAKPLRVFPKSPRLAWKMIFDQVSSYQYRIFGPHPWNQAIPVALNVDERVIKCTKTRETN